MKTTAIKRSMPSAPAKAIAEEYLIEKKTLRVLDYGCGFGKDAEYYEFLGHDVDKYDVNPPFNDPIDPTNRYDLITCTYVFNVIENPMQRMALLHTLLKFRAFGGILVVAVRRDVKNDGPTSKGWQGNVTLPGETLVLVKGRYEIYTFEG